MRQPRKRRRSAQAAPESPDDASPPETPPDMADPSLLVHRLVPELHHLRSISSLSSLLLVHYVPTGAALRDALLQRLQQEKESVFLQNLLSLLQLQTQGDDGVSFSHDAVIGFLRTADGSGHNRAHAQALGLLASSGHPVRLDEDLVLSLLASPRVAVRQRMVRLIAAESVRRRSADLNDGDDRVFGLFGVPVIVRILLVMASDIYPLVRRAAVDALVAILAGNTVDDVGYGLLEECYCRACDLVNDRDEFVRLGAVSIINTWAALLAEKREGDCRERLDLAFLQLCSLSRDAFVEVRRKALDALGSMTSVSEEVLRVSLSKKTLTVDGLPKLLLADAAGAFVEGLADEFYEVRKSACSSLALLTIFSNQFAADAVNLLTDMLADDSVVVRLKSLDAMSHMMAIGRLEVHKKHVHTLLGMLVDVNPDVRHATRQLLQMLKLPDLQVFISTFDGLLANIKSFLQDGPECLSVIFAIGRSHLNFVRIFAKEFLPEIQPSYNGELSLDRPIVMAFLMLIMALILSHEDDDAEIRSLLFLYGTNFIGKLSGCLAGIINNDLLLQFIHRYKYLSEQRISMDYDNEANNGNTHPLIDKEEVTSTFCSQERGSQQVAVQIHMEGRCYPEEIIPVVKCLLAQVGRIWPLILSRSTIEALRLLRGFIHELEMLSSGSHETDSVLVFAFQYMEVLRLLTKLCGNLIPRMVFPVGMATWDILLEKLDAALKRIMYTFRGLSTEEEGHLLELMLLTCVIRLSNPGTFSRLTIRKLLFLLSQVEPLPDTKSSGFIERLRETLSQGNVEDVPCPFPSDKLLQSFSLRTFSLCGRFKHIGAEMHISDNDSENPLPFISGLPVGITFQMKLFNVSNTDKIWLQMVVEGVAQHTFLHLARWKGSGEVRYYTGSVPLYKTPEVEAFSSKATIVMECPFEDYVGDYRGIGPKHELIYLCEEKEFFLVRMGVE